MEIFRRAPRDGSKYIAVAIGSSINPWGEFKRALQPPQRQIQLTQCCIGEIPAFSPASREGMFLKPRPCSDIAGPEIAGMHASTHFNIRRDCPDSLDALAPGLPSSDRGPRSSVSLLCPVCLDPGQPAITGCPPDAPSNRNRGLLPLASSMCQQKGASEREY